MESSLKMNQPSQFHTTKHQIDALLEQGFQHIQDDFLLMMQGLSETLVKFGKARFQDILPIVGTPQNIKNLPITDQTEAITLLSLAFQLLNVVEQHATDTFRNSVASAIGPAHVSGSIAEVLATLRHQGHSWDHIVDIWKSLSLQLVFTAHPTESRRSSLIGQLRQFFTDLQQSQGQPEHRRQLILKNLEILLGTGEFIQDKPSIETERDFITRTILGSLPEGLSLLEKEIRTAFTALGCPETLIPQVADHPQIRFRSWVASDRDGHPYVTATETALSLKRNREEAFALLANALRHLADSLSLSRHRVTVPQALVTMFSEAVPATTSLPEEPWRVFCLYLLDNISTLSLQEIVTHLGIIETTLRETGAHHLAHETSLVILRIKTFGHHLVAQDIRQNSDAYRNALVWILDQSGLDAKAYLAMSEHERCLFIAKEALSPRRFLPPDHPLSGPAKDAIESLRVAANAINSYGPESIGSLIVSMTRQSSDLLQVLLLAREAGLLDYSHTPPICRIPIVPLIETAEDHSHIIEILTGFLDNEIIATSVQALDASQYAPKTSRARDTQGRGTLVPSSANANGIQPFDNVQGPVTPFAPSATRIARLPGIRVMCGHSDGGKDAGIIDNFRMMRETRGKVSDFLANRGYLPIFFEGIGGTLIRGAAPIKYLIANSLPPHRVGGFEYTEQGQIIAQNHLVPFMSAWTLQNALAALLQHEAEHPKTTPHPWFKDATKVASNCYRELVKSPEFTSFFTHVTPLDLLEFSRMGSRPTRRTGANTLADLRAIPFALCQSQSRFNFTAWYGVGTMLAHLKETEPQHFELICHQRKHFPDIEFALTNVEMALKSASLPWMQAYATLEPTPHVRDILMAKITHEYRLTLTMLETVFGSTFETRRPRLATTIAKRKETLDVLHQVQIDSLTHWRQARKSHHPDEKKWLLTGLMTLNAISNGLRGTG
jgi:phosphoenolpyruvate carboxylase